MSNDMRTSIDGFNLVTLRLLDKLYDSFPRALDIDPNTAIHIGFSAVPNDATAEESWGIGHMTTDVVEWLAEEEFLRYEKDPNHRYGHFCKVRLSLKGLAILGAVPTAIESKIPQEPLISRIKCILKSGSQTIATESLKAVVSQIFKYALAPSAIAAAQLLQV